MSFDPFPAWLSEPFEPTAAGFNKRMREFGVPWRLTRADDGAWRLMDGDTPAPYPVDSEMEYLTVLVAQTFAVGALYGELQVLRRARAAAED